MLLKRQFFIEDKSKILLYVFGLKNKATGLAKVQC